MQYKVRVEEPTTHQEVFGLEISVDDDARVEVEEGAAQVLHHVGRVYLPELHRLRDRVKQVATLGGKENIMSNLAKLYRLHGPFKQVTQLCGLVTYYSLNTDYYANYSQIIYIQTYQ